MASTLEDKEAVGCGQAGILEMRHFTKVTILGFKKSCKRGMQPRKSIQRTAKPGGTEQSIYEHIALLQHPMNNSS